MITRRKFVESAAALGAAAFLPQAQTQAKTKTIYAETAPVTIESTWGSDKPEKYDVILYADSEKNEVGMRYVMKGTYSIENKGEEIRWWMSLEDAHRVVKNGWGEVVIHARWYSAREKSAKFVMSRSIPDNRFLISGPPGGKPTELYKVPGEDLEKLILAVGAAGA